MTVTPDPEMYDPNAPEFGETRAVEELNNDMKGINGTDDDVRAITDKLADHPGDFFLGETQTHRYSVVKTDNGRYLVTRHLLAEKKE